MFASGTSPEIVTLADPAALARAAAERFAALADEATASGGVFRVALSGGSTPKAMYQILGAPPFRDEISWDKIQVFFSDERFVPPDSAGSNFHTAQVGLLSKVPIRAAAIHRVATVNVTPRQAAQRYEDEIRRAFGAGSTETPRFDLIFLGLGPDGHTASLFPGTEALAERVRLVAPNYVPRLDSWRITFTYPLIDAGDTVMFLVQGQDKAERVAQVMAGEGDLPAADVHPDGGHLVWMLDAAAASLLSPGPGFAA